MKDMKVPVVVWKTRVRDDGSEDENPLSIKRLMHYIWEDLHSKDVFDNRRVLVFSLPGAFTPTCSTYQLPDFEKLAQEFYDLGIDDIYCISVNDSFVMNRWAKEQELKNVKVIPDGSCLFTVKMNMLVTKDNLGFGQRSWRYAMIVNNGIVESWFEEPGRAHNADEDPYGETSPQNILSVLNKKED